MYTVYFIRSTRNNKIYTGFTNKDPQERLKEHNQGSNTFSKQNKPFELVYYEEYLCKNDAQSREKFYKSGFGRQIRDVVIKYIDSIRTRSSAG